MHNSEEFIRIGGITDLSTVDWYGYASLVVFWAGCNFRCPYCQNSNLIPIDSGELFRLDLLNDRIEKALNPVETIEAVVFTGGEPLLQPKGLINAGNVVKKYGLKLMLDTNGSVRRSFREVIDTGLIDRVALDVKAPLKGEKYGKVAGLTKRSTEVVGSIRNVMETCKEKGVPLEIRTTVAPTVSDQPDMIRSIAEEIRGYSTVYYLQQYDNQGEILDERLKNMDPPSREDLFALANEARLTGLKDIFIKTRQFGLERVC